MTLEQILALLGFGVTVAAVVGGGVWALSRMNQSSFNRLHERLDEDQKSDEKRHKEFTETIHGHDKRISELEQMHRPGHNHWGAS